VEFVGDRDHRAYVGPAERYDVVGATQFSLLYSLGLRSHHRLLDIGCGSLRGGRLFIAYLDAGCYTGLEPHRWLIEQAIQKEIGEDLIEIKSPTFVYNDQFDVSGLGVFDFVLAQSVASHTGPKMTRDLLSATQRALAPDGIAAINFWNMRSDQDEEGWFYPECVGYRIRTIHRWLDEAGLKGRPIPWFHPGALTWWIVNHAAHDLPPRRFLSGADGATLAYPGSWHLRSRIRRTHGRVSSPSGANPLKRALARRGDRARLSAIRLSRGLFNR
jgi:SAM-dependent methyltransferase